MDSLCQNVCQGSLAIMVENQSISEKERMDHWSNPDLLSDLPLSIIHIILSFVPIIDAVRTSVLSRQWRYTWGSLPNLVFKEFRGNENGEPIHKFGERVKNTITHVLFRHQGPIHKFKTPIFSEIFFPDVDKWILHLSKNDIKELILDMGTPHLHCHQELYSSIYSCEKLTNLVLENCNLDLPPSSFKGFLFLRRLSLHDVYLSSDGYHGIESLVANCPFLEDFTLHDNGFSDATMLRISAPNLKCLDLSGHYSEICLCTPLLAEVPISTFVNYYADVQLQQKSSVCNYTNFFGGLTNLEKLCGETDFIQYLSIGMESRRQNLAFLHLKDIELHEVDFDDLNQMYVVTFLIIGAPNLQKLKISTDYCIRDVASCSETPTLCFSQLRCASGFTFAKLRVVIMEYVGGSPSEAEFLVFLLQMSPVLETMTVNYLDTLGSVEKQLLKDLLLEYDWASPNADLVTPVIR